MKTVMIISDATGETAERMVRAATLQFSEPVQIRLFSRVRLESELEQILEKAAEQRARAGVGHTTRARQPSGGLGQVGRR